MDAPTRLICVGLDPSPKRLGWALVEVTETGRKPLDCGCFHMEQSPQSTLWAQKGVIRKVAEWGGAMTSVVIEKPYVGVSPAIALAIAETMGAVTVLSAAAWPKAHIYRLSPAEWRKRSGLSGRATKAEVMSRARFIGFDAKEQDAADAGLMAWAGALGPASPRPPRGNGGT